MSQRVKLNFGVGYQVAVLPTKLTLEPLTPMFDHSVLFTARYRLLSGKIGHHVGPTLRGPRSVILPILPSCRYPLQSWHLAHLAGDLCGGCKSAQAFALPRPLRVENRA
jgi:hypothetical protein